MANRPAIAKTYLARSQNRFLLRTQATMGIQASPACQRHMTANATEEIRFDQFRALV